MCLIKEVWKDIPDYPNYQVSNYGRIKSLERTIIYKDGSKHLYKEKILKPSNDKDGYLLIGLHKDNKCQVFRVHRLVALAFIPNPENLPIINHKNEIKTDNRVENLEFCSARYNVTYNDAHIKRGENLKGKFKGENNPFYGKHHTDESKKKIGKAHKGRISPNRKPILQYTLDMVLIRDWDSATTASKELNINLGHITECCRGERNKCGGFIWKYKENNTNLVIS
jgi:hypothetical protein